MPQARHGDNAQPDRRRFFSQLLDGARSQTPRRAPWRRVPEVGAGDGDVLWSGWAGDGEVFVVGDEGMVLRYTGAPDAAGRQWERMSVPTNLPLHGLWGPSPDRLIAVGWMGTILHFDGTEWHQQRGGIVDDEGRFAPCSENTPLFAIDGNATGEAWAVGDDGMILHYHGGEWHREASPTRINLRAVACAPSGTVYAAGGEGTLLRRDPEGRWLALDCPLGSGFQAMLLLGDDELLLGGGRYFVDQGGFRGELVHYRHGEFQALTFDTPMPRLRALKAYKGGVLIVGDQGHLYYLKELRLDRLESNSHHDLMDIITLPTGEALAVGDFGTIMTAAPDFTAALAPPPAAAQPSPWSAMASPTANQLWGIHEAGDGTCYACGEAGSVLRLDADGWRTLPAPSELAVHCLWDSGNGLFAAGQLGRIYRFDGSRWQLHFDLHLDLTILALWGSGPDSIYAVGDEGLILHFDGQRWQLQPTRLRDDLLGLAGTPAAGAFAVGTRGRILRLEEGQWLTEPSGSDVGLRAVCTTRNGGVYAVGDRGTILRRD